MPRRKSLVTVIRDMAREQAGGGSGAAWRSRRPEEEGQERAQAAA